HRRRREGLRDDTRLRRHPYPAHQRYGGHPGSAEEPRWRWSGADVLYRRGWSDGLRLALWQLRRRHDLEPEVPARLLPRLKATHIIRAGGIPFHRGPARATQVNGGSSRLRYS